MFPICLYVEAVHLQCFSPTLYVGARGSLTTLFHSKVAARRFDILALRWAWIPSQWLSLTVVHSMIDLPVCSHAQVYDPQYGLVNSPRLYHCFYIPHRENQYTYIGSWLDMWSANMAKESTCIHVPVPAGNVYSLHLPIPFSLLRGLGSPWPELCCAARLKTEDDFNMEVSSFSPWSHAHHILYCQYTIHWMAGPRYLMLYVHQHHLCEQGRIDAGRGHATHCHTRSV